MKKTVKKHKMIAIFTITIMLIASACGKKEPKVYTANDIYVFKRVTDIDKDTYYVNKNGIEMTKRQYDELFNFFGRSDIFHMTKEMFEQAMDDDWPDVCSFGYENDLEEIGTFNKLWSIVKVKEETYKNTEDGNEDFDWEGAAGHALDEIDYEPIAVRTAYDSGQKMWRVSLFSKDDGEEVVYTNVYMTEKGKTELITRVTAYAQSIW